jgi:hypothetical protein
VMDPSTGTAPQIIAIALKLGLLCRPVHSTRVGVGEALWVSKESFFIMRKGGTITDGFIVRPDELLMTWELSTPDIINDEWRKANEQPW